VPIHSEGYRGWDGRRAPGALRWAVIASTGIRRTWKSKWLRRILFVAVLPTLFLAIPIFLFEQAIRDPQLWRGVVSFLQTLPQTESVGSVFSIDPLTATPEEINEARHQVWAYLLLTLFRYPQAILMVLTIGIAAPPLISNDVRSRAFLIYFSRPITRLEYILGKMGTMFFFLAMITTLPAILLYTVGVLLSPSFDVIVATWDLPLRILLASVTLMLPTTAVALMFSSTTSESRYAAFGWFSIWIIGYVTFGIVMVFAAASAGQLEDPGWRSLLSPYHVLGIVQEWVFGLATTESMIAPAAVILTAVTCVSLGILFHRVSSPMRA
jgi:ABC-type transport system involved in multi-copper enzyme maturation permease subunit